MIYDDFKIISVMLVVKTGKKHKCYMCDEDIRKGSPAVSTLFKYAGK